jgi:hypothetical protein
MRRLIRGVTGPTFQIAVEFSSDSPFTDQRLNEAEQLLHAELGTGLLCGHEAIGPAARLLIVTSTPDECVSEIMQLLEPLEMTARRAVRRALQPDPYDRLIPIGEWCRFEITLVPHGQAQR